MRKKKMDYFVEHYDEYDWDEPEKKPMTPQKKIVILFIILAIAVASPFVYNQYKAWDARLDAEAHEKAIRWYIENNKPPYDMYDTYEEYLEDVENGEISTESD